MRPPRAFTLVEVLLALVIFALTAVVLGGAYVNVLNGYESARQANADDADVSFARSQLLALSDLTAAQAGAEFDDGDRHVKWTAEVDPAETTDLFTVTFTCVVTEGAGLGAKTVAETFMLLRPTWSDPTARSELRQGAATRIAVLQGKQAK
ncbi:MAG TPA: prepilin-type N-terminal cleavage/methylation domain-containing protein [Opitutaceae bacterium]|nr:prepilin-type N-terminal cleavage/methylation domain-containing protein [Opitutaceae bacterium]